MAITYMFPFLVGTTTERTGGTFTGLQSGLLYLETDGKAIYRWNSSSWDLIGQAGGTTLAGLTLTTPTINGMVLANAAKTANYTLTATDSIISADASGGAFTLTLPTAVGAKAMYTIKRTDILASSNLVTIVTTSSQTISGTLNQYLWPGEKLSIVSDNANWHIVNHVHTSGQHNFMLKGTTASRAYVAGALDQSSGLTTSTTSLTANTLFALPFIVPQNTKFDLITFRITTASTAGNSRAGIYRDNGNCYPGALIFDTGSISTTSPGSFDTTISTTPPSHQVFPRGLYWLAYEQDTATGQMVCITSSTNWGILGFPKALNASPGHAYSIAHTFGTLPDPYTAGAAILNAVPAPGTPYPAIGLRPI